MFFEISLVILFGFVEWHRLNKFRHNGAGVTPALLLLPLGLLSRFPLLKVAIENRGAVLAADVRPLPIASRGIVDAPERG